VGREPIVAEIDEKVMKFVEKTLEESPDIQLEELFEKASSVGEGIKDLSKRQFNARYPLQVKRRRSQALRSSASPVRKKKAAPKPRISSRGIRVSAGPRESVRQVFLQFATDLTGAEERKDLVRVLADVDNYVDQVLKGVAKA